MTDRTETSIQAAQLNKNRTQHEIHTAIRRFQNDTGLLVTNIDIQRYLLTGNDIGSPFEITITAELQ